MAFISWFSGRSRVLPAGRALLPGGRAALLLSLLASAACSQRRSPPPAEPARPAESAPTPAARSAPDRDPAASPAANNDRVLTLLVTTRMRNNIEACGCTSEPLGDVARLAALVKSSRAVLLDAGGLRYDEDPIPADKLPQVRKKAEFLEDVFGALAAVTMLQPEDLRGRPDGSELGERRRLASNVGGLPPGSLVPEVVRTAAGVKLGVLGLADPEGSWPKGVQVSDPLAAAQAAVQRLRRQGAQVLVALTGLRREQARRLARKLPELQLIVAGNDRELAEGVDPPEVIGGTLLVVPGQKGERITRLVLHLPPSGPPQWTVYPSPRQRDQLIAQQRAKLQAAQARLAGLRRDPAADPAFVKTTEDEVRLLETQLAAAAPAAPPTGGYVVSELVPITRALPRDEGVAAQMTALDRQIGESNLAATAGPPAPPPVGQPRYVGNAGCLGSCHYHSDSFEFWQKTRHAGAWKTLVEGGKDLSYDCVGCHASGFDAPGGSNLWTLAQWQRATPQKTPPPAAGPDLRNIQCEVCHGPGSLHARSPIKVAMPTPRPSEERCLGCHTKDHSDTFAITPYLRDILGPGHGEDRRRQLGDGPTGRELRSAALRAHAPH